MKSILELQSYIEDMMEKTDSNDGSHGHWLDCWYMLQDIEEDMAQRTLMLIKAAEQGLSDDQKHKIHSLAAEDIKAMYGNINQALRTKL